MVNLDKIKGLMREHGETQRDLANLLACSATSANNYLTGKTEMKVGDVVKIAKHYNVELNDIVVD